MEKFSYILYFLLVNMVSMVKTCIISALQLTSRSPLTSDCAAAARPLIIGEMLGAG